MLLRPAQQLLTGLLQSQADFVPEILHVKLVGTNGSEQTEVLEGIQPVDQVTVDMPLPYTVAQLETPGQVRSITGAPAEGAVYVWAWEEPGFRWEAG